MSKVKIFAGDESELEPMINAWIADKNEEKFNFRFHLSLGQQWHGMVVLISYDTLPKKEA